MKLLQTICKRFVLLLIVLIVCINIVACDSTIAANKQINSTELIELIQADKAPVILDVRTSEEYLQGHIPGAINIEYRELPSRIDEVRNLGKRKIVVYCERGVRANIAEETLEKAGFSEVLHLEGDMSGWRDEGLKIDK